MAAPQLDTRAVHVHARRPRRTSPNPSSSTSGRKASPSKPIWQVGRDRRIGGRISPHFVPSWVHPIAVKLTDLAVDRPSSLPGDGSHFRQTRPDWDVAIFGAQARVDCVPRTRAAERQVNPLHRPRTVVVVRPRMDTLTVAGWPQITASRMTLTSIPRKKKSAGILFSEQKG